MSFEPRMRGRRFLRPAMKKSKRTKERPPAFAYTSEEKTDLGSVLESILNAVDHLGNQRFALPPFAEHFQRWRMDLQVLLDEFKNQFPEVNDGILQDEIQGLLTKLQDALSNHSAMESERTNELSKLQQEVTQLEIKLSKLERNYRSKNNELRRQHLDVDSKYRSEIDALDRKRIQILRKKPSILQRLTRRSNTELKNANTMLEDKKTQARDDEQSFEAILLKNRNEYARNHQTIISQIDLLRQRIGNNSETTEDALEIRNQTCQQIHSAIDRAMSRNHSNEPQDA